MAAPNIGSPLTALTRLSGYLALTIPCMVVQIVALAIKSPIRASLPLWYHGRSCKILGIRVERRGRQSREHPTLYVCNHVSYFDVIVLGSLIKGCFVAKSEVARWPFFGWLAHLQRSVFVKRHVNHAATQRDQITDRLEQGDDLILFPEGTSSDGNWVLPFKSALFSAAEREPNGKPLVVQPVSITYSRLDGVPMGRYLRPLFAWYGDMELVSHLWQAIGMGFVTVVVEFHKPVTFADFGSRKTLSEHCQREVAAGVAVALSGRRPRAAEESETAVSA